MKRTGKKLEEKQEEEEKDVSNVPISSTHFFETIVGIRTFSVAHVPENVFVALTVQDDHAVQLKISKKIKQSNIIEMFEAKMKKENV